MTTNLKGALFNGLEPDAATAVAVLGASQMVRAGEVLFTLGQPANHLYVIERGRLSMTLPIEVAGSDEDIQVEEEGADGIVGWSALIPPYRFTLKATALVDTVVLAIPRAALFDYFETRPQIGRIVTANVAAVIGHRLQLFQTMWLREMSRVIKQQLAVRHGAHV